MNSNKELPISLKNSITTECWTYYRFAIIDAYEEFRTWKSQNFNKLYSDQNGNLFFGAYNQQYNPYRAYNDVLTTKGYFFHDICHTKIVDFIREKINYNVYTLLECDYSYLILKDEGYIHEILIFGYDDEKKVFITTILYNHKWIRYEVNYDDVEEAYMLAGNRNKEQITKELYRQSYLYPITLLTPRLNNFFNYDICLLYFDICYIRNEVLYQNIIEQKTKSKMACSDGYLCCYKKLIYAGKCIIEDSSKYHKKEYDYSNNIKKLLEYRKLFHQGINSIFEHYEIELPPQSIHDIDEIITQLNNCCSLSLKYQCDNQIKYLHDVIQRLENLYTNEEVYIEYLYVSIQDFLIKKLKA